MPLVNFGWWDHATQLFIFNFPLYHFSISPIFYKGYYFYNLRHICIFKLNYISTYLYVCIYIYFS